MTAQAPTPRGRAADAGLAALVFLWPAVYLAPYLVPVAGVGRQSGNDFRILYYKYKVYLLDWMASQGRIPLWSPSEAAGFPFFSNPFTAALYPLNWPLALWYDRAGGYSMHDHQVFAVLGVCLLALGLFAWLRAAGGAAWASALAAALLATCLRSTELLRFPNAVHAAAWVPWILCGLTLAARRRTLWYGAGITAAATGLLLTAGYPYIVYYLQLLVGPYLAISLWPRGRRALGIERAGDVFPGALRYGSAVAAGFGVPLLLCAPYLAKVAGMLGQTASRGGGDFAFATRAPWDWHDALGSLVHPPAASAEGWSYFGMANLLVIALFAVGATRRAGDRDARLFLAVLGTWIAAVVAISLESESPLFRALWHVWPGFSSLRVWARVNVVLVPLFALLLCRAASALGDALTEPAETGAARLRRRLALLGACYAPVLALQLGLLASDTVSYQWPRYFAIHFERLPVVDESWFARLGLASAAVLAALLVACARRPLRSPRVAAALVAGALALTAVDVGPLGVLQWSHAKSPRDLERRRLASAERMPRALWTPRVGRDDTIQLGPSFAVGAVEHWYFGRYVDLLTAQGLGTRDYGRPEAWRERPELSRLLGLGDGRRLFFASSLDHASVADFLADADATEAASGFSLRVQHYDGDALSVRVATDAPGYLCFIDNWDPDWRARVNGASAPIERLFGTFKAVALAPGESAVELRYQPFAFALR